MKNKTASWALGQLMIAGFEGTEMSAGLRELLAHIQPAGVILFARNIVSAAQTYQLLQDCRASVSRPLFACVDMEGGTVDRFRKVLGPSPSAADVYSTREPRLFQKHGRIIGQSCRRMGFNTDFAPVVDLAFAASATVMSSRAVSADAAEAARYAREFLAGLASADVIGAIKHFPGLGEANLDTHHELPCVGKSWRKLWQEDLEPYRALRRIAPMVLVGHAAYPAVTGDGTPASLSKKWITEVLRRKIGYRRLVVSDDLEMGGVLKAASIGEAAVGHIRAGGDLCLVCHVSENVELSYEALVREAERDSTFARRCQQSLMRVEKFKRGSPFLRRPATPPSAKTVQQLTTAVWEFGEQVRLANLRRQAEA